ncbi:hypothetical protein B488_11570 [Liberibacter crescens BT-1]|uniref:Uncharacterized protein n=1 Tax=Liberibacter crescens (strain BT-1) TaxID=1215343 RepID=L0EUC6_LIBCB|nr:hypothetical protein [Liberibacter crescens]AGA65149.1 hypothetical protein B488_11570 [Liberibacter crescens BT-1]
MLDGVANISSIVEPNLVIAAVLELSKQQKTFISIPVCGLSEITGVKFKTGSQLD